MFKLKAKHRCLLEKLFFKYDMIVAIQPDNHGPRDSSSLIWSRLLQNVGHKIQEVNVYRADILDQLRDCHGFMWRHVHSPNMRQIARRLLPIIERELDLIVYPDQNTCWHYDDKIAQRYLLDVVGIPIPKTWIWFDSELAKEWARQAEYPLVLKLCSGAGSTNVRLLKSIEDAELWIDRLFGRGIHHLADRSIKPWGWGRQRIKAATKLLLKGIPPDPAKPAENAWELHKNYIMFQQFLPGNEFDTRVTVIGNRAFGFRRFNRDNDFRASGSGKIDYDPSRISMEFVQLAFEIAHRLGTQSCAIDGLWRGSEAVVAEISYTYASWAVHDCPGHWELENNKLKWRKGHMWPEEAQIQDFLKRLEDNSKTVIRRGREQNIYVSQCSTADVS